MSPARSTAWMIWFIASLFYAYQYILRVMPNVMLDDIMQQFGIGAATFGQFSGIYYIGYSLAHLPIGIMLDRFGPKKIMTGCILLTVIGLLPLIFSIHYSFPIFGRMLVGIGSSAAVLGLFKIIRMFFEEKQFSRLLSFSITIGLVGAIYGGSPVGYLRDVIGYETVVLIFAAAGIILSAVTYWLIPDMTTTTSGTVLSDIKEVFSNKKVLVTCFCAGLMVGPLEGFADVWGSAFLKSVYGFDATVAATLPSFIFIGMCFGGPLLSYIAEKLNHYSATIVGAGALMAFVFFAFIGWQLSSALTSAALVVTGICCAYQVLAIYQATTFVREELAGITSAVANMIMMIFGYVFHASMGAIINYMGGPTSEKALIYGIAIVPIALSLGTIGFIFLMTKQRQVELKV